MTFRRALASLARAERAARNPSDGLSLDFHSGRRAEFVRGPRRKRLRKLGELRGVVYTTRKGGSPITDYVHGFSRRRPVLAMDSKRNLHIVRTGSRYTVTRRGIEG